MQFDIPVATPASPLLAISPSSSRSSSLAGQPRKSSPLRGSSTPEEGQQLRLTSAEGSSKEGHVGLVEGDIPSEGETSSADLGRRASEGTAIALTSHAGSSFAQTSLSKSSSNLTEVTTSSQSHTIRTPSARPHAAAFTSSHNNSSTNTISNVYYTLPPIRTTPKFPHSASLRPLRPLSSTSPNGGGGSSSGNGGLVGSLNSVPHAGAATVGRTPHRQKIIVPTKSWKACFDLNLTQKELARFD